MGIKYNYLPPIVMSNRSMGFVRLSETSPTDTSETLNAVNLRKKLNFTAFIAINDEFTKHYYQEKPLIELWNQEYLLVACDGSLIQLPESKELADDFGRWKNHIGSGMVMSRASLLYDVVHRITLAAELTPCTTGERELFMKHYQQSEKLLSSHTPIFLMDRGYPSFELCKDLDKEKKKFVIRCKAGFCKEVAAFAAQDSFRYFKKSDS